MYCLETTLRRSLLIFMAIIKLVVSGFAQDVPYTGGFLPAPLLTFGPGTTSEGGGAGAVGGIAFDEKAKLHPALQINSLTIGYDGLKPDGSRLQLTINGNKCQYTLYDWQLIPLVRYADSPYTACFTYFGKLVDKNLENLILNNEGHIMNYHPDLFNTLLGWRLAYMDLMVMYEFTTDLPRVNGIRILGAGETAPDITANTNGQARFINQLYTIESDLGYTFRSYVITDYSREIQISLKNDTLNLSGYPLFRCWHFRQDTKGFNSKSVSDSIVNRYQTILNNELAKNPSFYQRGLYIDSLITLSVKYKKEYPVYSGGTFVDLVSIETASEKRIFLERYATESLKKMLFETAALMEAYRIIFLPEYSNRMSQNPELLKACNPAIWNATVLTMRTAAFFRYLKVNYPAEWQTLVTQVKDKYPEPAVRTPTVLYKSGNTVIENAIRTGIPALPEKAKEILVYPNPVKDILFIDNISQNSLISIFSSDGKVLIRESASGVRHRINLKEWKPGIYLLRIDDRGNDTITKSIIKSY